MVSQRPLLVSHPALVGGAVTGGITTRRGFPAATEPGHDDPARAEGREILARMIGLDHSGMSWLKQIHGCEVRVVNQGGLAGEADALVTAEESIALLVAVADCGPVLLFDRDSGVIAAVHAGWRGTVAGVCESAIATMTGLGADPERTTAWVGPCIGPEAFEVGEEVADRFPPECVIRSQEPGAKPHVDLAAAIRARLLAAGLVDKRVTVSGQCTVELAERYWSYRRDGGICGRQFAWIVREG